MNGHRAVKFHRGSSPYEAGDIAGFPEIHAQRYVDRGVAEFWPPVSASASNDAGLDILDAMDRLQLIEFGKTQLGILDVPAAAVSDDDLRGAIRGSIDAVLLKVAPHAAAPAALMQVAPAGLKRGKSQP